MFHVLVWLFQLLDNMESKMKATCVEGTIPKLFEGKMLVSETTFMNNLQKGSKLDIFSVR